MCFLFPHTLRPRHPCLECLHKPTTHCRASRLLSMLHIHPRKIYGMRRPVVRWMVIELRDWLSWLRFRQNLCYTPSPLPHSIQPLSRLKLSLIIRAKHHKWLQLLGGNMAGQPSTRCTYSTTDCEMYLRRDGRIFRSHKLLKGKVEYFNVSCLDDSSGRVARRST